MQYFGYLRRDPNAAPDSDMSGYNFWLMKLNQFDGNYINAEMIKALRSSIEDDSHSNSQIDRPFFPGAASLTSRAGFLRFGRNLHHRVALHKDNEAFAFRKHCILASFETALLGKRCFLSGGAITMPPENCQKHARLLLAQRADNQGFWLAQSARLQSMATRNGSVANNNLQEAMALLIRNQAAFVEQISRNDQERLSLQRETEEWKRKSDERFARIEARLDELPKQIVQAVLDQLPRIKKEIGFKTPR